MKQLTNPNLYSPSKPRHLAFAFAHADVLALAGGDWFNSRTVVGETQPVVISHENNLGPVPNASVSPDTDVFTATGLPVNIPDSDSNGVTINLPVNHPGRATGLTVSLHIPLTRHRRSCRDVEGAVRDLIRLAQSGGR